MNKQKFIIINNQFIINIDDIVEIYLNEPDLLIEIIYINEIKSKINCNNKEYYNKLSKEIINKLKIN